MTHIAIRLGRKPSGGMSAFVRNLASSLAQLSSTDRISLLCIGDAWPNLHGEVHTFGAGSVADEYRLDAVEIGRWVRRNGVDALLCPGNQVARTHGKTLWWPLTVAPYEAIALQSVAEGMSGKVRWAGVRRSLALSARWADASIFSSNYARQLYTAALSEQLPALQKSIVLRPTTSIEVKESVASSPRYLLTVSNFNRYKFVEQMLRSFAESRLFDEGWGFKLVGRFPIAEYERKVRRLALDLGLQGAVDFTGGRDPAELVDLYSGASGYLFASVSENAASYTVIDALAFGLPTVSSFYSSSPEILGNAVRYADPYSVEDMASNLSALASPEERDRLAARARERAAGFPTWLDTAAGLVEHLSVLR